MALLERWVESHGILLRVLVFLACRSCRHRLRTWSCLSCSSWRGNDTICRGIVSIVGDYMCVNIHLSRIFIESVTTASYFRLGRLSCAGCMVWAENAYLATSAPGAGRCTGLRGERRRVKQRSLPQIERLHSPFSGG